MKNVMVSTLGFSSKTITEMYQALKFEGVKIEEIHLIATQSSKPVPDEFKVPED